MQLPEEGYLLRIFIGEADKHEGKPLYEWMFRQAQARGLAGATVMRGLMGYGANSREIHTFKIERLSSDLPLVVELVDTKENLDRFLETVESHISAGLVTLEKAQIRVYRSDSK